MKCYHPLTAFRIDGKIVFNSPFPYAKGFNLPCGQCVGCRLNYSRQWATRIMHEAQMHETSCFITLTFNPESLNNREVPSSLDVREFQRFMKRLRKKHGEAYQILPLWRIWRTKPKTTLPCNNIWL